MLSDISKVKYFQYTKSSLEICKIRFRNTLEALGEDSSSDSVFSAMDTGCDGGSQKHHTKLMDELAARQRS